MTDNAGDVQSGQQGTEGQVGTGAETGTGTASGSATGSQARWTDSIKDDGLKTSLAKFESQDKLFEAIGYKPPQSDWRAELKDDDAKKFAESSADINHLVKRAIDFRAKLSNAIVRPGKNATPEEVSAYRKAVGIPEKAEDYEFPDLPKGIELTDEVKASRLAWGKRFLDLGVPKETAKNLVQIVNEEAQRTLDAQIKADKDFAKASEEKLRAEWKGEEYERNKTIANRAFSAVAERAGVKLDELTHIETKDGRFLMDRPELVRLFAAIGREMEEGSLGSTLTSAELETLDDQIRDVRKQVAEAQAEGDSKRANRLYQKEQALIAKKGNKPVVGSQGRAA